MPNSDQDRLAREIAEAYQASGICAKVHGGYVFVEREEGWAGPLDPRVLKMTYRDEIERVETSVQHAVAECFDRFADNPLGIEDRETWFLMFMSPLDFIKLGFTESKAAISYRVAQALQYRGDLGP